MLSAKTHIYTKLRAVQEELSRIEFAFQQLELPQAL